MKYTLPKLNYSFDALEPYIDSKTVEIHYSKHHQTYLNNLNTILEKYPAVSDKNVESMLKDIKSLPFEEKDRNFFKNNAGGVVNHNLYWQIMGPKKEIDEKLRDDITKEFGSIEEFKKLFSSTALSHFGSGWAWLVRDEANKLQVYSLPNQDSPISLKHTLIIALDIWEHAYYLKYQNRRAEYIENWWNVFKLF